MDRELIEHYANGGDKLSLAIRGLTQEDLLAPPDPDWNAGKWSIQQVVIHAVDSDLVSSDRLKRMIAEENPTLIGYDENKFVANLFYEDQSADQAIALLDANRKLFTGVLRKLPAKAFERKGTHNERGTLTVGAYLKSTVEHLDHHINFIHKKRAKMGKEMW
jgi:DinB family protein